MPLNPNYADKTIMSSFKDRYFESRYEAQMLGDKNVGNYDYDAVVSRPFGFGLSYTTFEYGKPTVDNAVMTADGSVTVRVRVKNTGSREGQEVVQLYVSDVKASLPRPVKELKGFQKVRLAPGEEKEVVFTLRKDALSFFDADQHRWVAEPGKFEAIVAASAADIKGRVAFELE